MIFRHFLSHAHQINVFFTSQDGGELLFYFSLAILDLGIRLRLGHGRGICTVSAFIIPSTCIRERDIVIAPLVIPSTCIRERDIVIAPLVVCLSVCLSVCVST